MDLNPEEQITPPLRSVTPESAFRDSEHYAFRDTLLQPFSFSRETAAVELGFKHWRLKPDQIHEVMVADPDAPGELKSAFVYDGMHRDVAILLWVCSQPDRVVKQARAYPGKFEDAIDAFADEAGLGIDGPGLAEGLTVFTRMLADRRAAIGDPRPGHGDPDGAGGKAPAKEEDGPGKSCAPPVMPNT